MVLFPKGDDAGRCIQLLVPVIALLVNVITQVLLVRASRGTHFMRSLAGGFLAGFIALAALSVFSIAHYGLSVDLLALCFLVNAPTYAALSYCYSNFANLGHTSIRIRLYSEIASSKNGVSIETIVREYDERALMNVRLDRLLEGGDIVLRDGRYYVKRKRLAFIAAVIFAAKRLVLGRTSQFESR